MYVSGVNALMFKGILSGNEQAKVQKELQVSMAEFKKIKLDSVWVSYDVKTCTDPQGYIHHNVYIILYKLP